MSQQRINYGTVANDAGADTIRAAFTKTDANFVELYGAAGLLPSWVTSGRPSSPTAGMEGWNATLARRETWNGSAWVQYFRTGDVGTTTGTVAAGDDSRIINAAPLNPLPVAIAGALTLTFGAHHGHKLYSTASATVTITNAATLTDGFWTCVETDAGHTITLSGTVYDRAGNLVTTIPPSAKAEIEVWGGQVYADVLSTGLASALTHGTATSAINFVGFDGGNLDYRFGFDDFVSYALAAGGVFSKRVAVAPVALTDATTIATNAALGNVFTITLGGNRTLGNPTNLVAGQEVTYIATQDGTGNRTLAYGTLFTHPGGVAPVLSTAAGAVDMLSYIYDGVKLRGGISKAYA